LSPDQRALGVLLRFAARGDAPHPAALPPLDRVGWEALVAGILRQRVASIIGEEALSWGMPADLGAELTSVATKQRVRSQWMLLELRRVLSALGEAGIPVVVLKGAALAHVFHSARYFLDLDVLVPPAELDRATRALEAIGFSRADMARSTLYYERHHFHRVLRSQNGLMLELHWDLARPSDYFHLDATGVCARARTVPFDGISMSVPCEADQLLHAAEQCLREGFSEARRVLDTANLLRGGADHDPGLAARAVESGLGTALWALLVASKALVGTDAETTMRALRPSRPSANSLLALDLPALFLEQRAKSFPGLRSWLHLLCAPSAAVATRTFLSTVFPGERGLLEDGHPPEAGPSRMRQGILSLKRIGQTVKMAAYQTWRLTPLPRTRGIRHT